MAQTKFAIPKAPRRLVVDEELLAVPHESPFPGEMLGAGGDAGNRVRASSRVAGWGRGIILRPVVFPRAQRYGSAK